MKYTLRIPEELAKEVKELAKKQGMSVNAYILLSISQFLNS